MRAGRIEQLGTPHEVFNEPATRFVAGFIGESNFLPARRAGPADAAGLVPFEAGGGLRLSVPEARLRGGGERFVLAFRPHHVRVAPGAANAAILRDTVYAGTSMRQVLDVGGVQVVALALSQPGAVAAAPGSALRFDVAPEAITGFAGDDAR